MHSEEKPTLHVSRNNLSRKNAISSSLFKKSFSRIIVLIEVYHIYQNGDFQPIGIKDRDYYGNGNSSKEKMFFNDLWIFFYDGEIVRCFNENIFQRENVCERRC